MPLTWRSASVPPNGNSSGAVPPTADALLAAAGTGQTGPDYGGGVGEKGMPVSYDRCWDFGVVAMGTVRRMEFSFGAVNGTPSAPSPGPDENDGKAFLGRLGFAPWPAFRVGVSGAYGPYLPEGVQSALPAGARLDDFHQRLGMADLELQLGHYEVRAEGYVNVWETPTVGDLRIGGGYVEGKATVIPSLYVAGRYEVMRFGQLAGATVTSRPWDENRDRLEAGLGYRVARRAALKTVFQRNLERPVGEDVKHADLYAVAFSLGF